MNITVTLTPDELYQAAIVGAHRRITCLSRRKVAQHYDDANGYEWATEIEACCAEIALSKHLGWYWSGGVFNGNRAEHDVGNKQVRHTVYQNGSLIIYPEDNPQDRFVLVTGKAPAYTIRGWVLGDEVMCKGKDHVWWTHPNHKRCPSWWVPQSALRPLVA